MATRTAWLGTARQCYSSIMEQRGCEIAGLLGGAEARLPWGEAAHSQAPLQ